MKKLMILLIGLWISIVSASVVFAQTNFSFEYENEKFIDNIGFDWQYGRDYFLPNGWKGEHSLNTVNRWSFRAETRKVFSHNWGIQSEILYSAHKADENPDHGQDTSFKEFGINLAVKYYWFDDLFYIGWFAGLSYVKDFPHYENRDYWSDRDIESNIGHSHILGSWGPMIGKDWNLNKIWALRTEFRISHTSDPFRSDKGKNYGTCVIGLTYRFGK